MPPKKKEEEVVVPKDNLLDELDNLDAPAPDEDAPAPADDVVEPEPELSIVDSFVNGDMDAVRQTIQDQVIKTVSDVVNGTPEVEEPAPAPEPDADPE